jgi:hypothetical protein
MPRHEAPDQHGAGRAEQPAEVAGHARDAHGRVAENDASGRHVAGPLGEQHIGPVEHPGDFKLIIHE